MHDQPDDFRPSRRIVFHGLAALGIAAALAGCGTDNVGSTAPSAPLTGGTGGSGGSGSGLKAGTRLATTSEVPVGGGVIVPDAAVVITQETAGTFKAFSAICTHQGFLVTSVEGAMIKCSHHGSEYNANTGAVVLGPAPVALAPIPIAVKGGAVLAA